jgi:hypothetical protein
MRQIRLFTLLFALLPLISNATDIFVNEFGTGGAYSSISAAITAASPNDRIIIKPRSGAAAYAENLTINKPLQLLCATDSTQWKLQGSVTFGAMNSGEYYAIVGMLNQQGDLTATSGPASTPRAKLYVLGCSFNLGSITVTGSNIEFTLANTNLDAGLLTAKFIRAFGNTISAITGASTTSVVSISSDATSSNDTCFFVGNTVINANYSGSGYFIGASIVKWTNSTQFHCIMNNFVKGTNPYSNTNSASGIEVSGAKSGSGTNCIINNTVYMTTGSTFSIAYGIYFTVATSTNTQVFNNISVGPITTGFYKSTSNPASFSYNFSQGGSFGGFITNDGTNSTIAQASINAVSGVSSVTDNGYPSPIFYDTDLTVNDAGCYGGSFTLTNYQPIRTGSTRVYYVDAPRSVIQGGQINIKAEGYDR